MVDYTIKIELDGVDVSSYLINELSFKDTINLPNGSFKLEDSFSGDYKYGSEIIYYIKHTHILTYIRCIGLCIV